MSDARTPERLKPADEIARLGRLFDRSPSFAAIATGPQHRFVYVNPAYQALTGGRPLLGLTVAETFPELVERGVLDLLDQVYRTGAPHVGEEVRLALRDADGRETVRYIDFVYQSVVDEDGRPLGIFTVGSDVTARVRARREERRLLNELRASEQRYRAIGESLPFGVWTADAEGRCDYVSPSFCEMIGRDLAQVREFGWLDRLVCGAEETLEHWLRSVRTGVPFERVHRFRAADGSEKSVLASGRPIRDADGTVLGWAGINLDVTDRQEATERELMLAREVDHRAKNALAVVQSLLRLTPFEDRDSFVASLTGRVDAMARVHGLLSRSRWSRPSVGELVAEELAPYGRDGADRVRVDGPAIDLNVEAAQPLSMLIHELATNAAKYGALSVPQGTVEVTWRRTGEGDGAGLALVWTERGGPPPPVDRGAGFGCKLIDGAARQLGGSVVRTWTPEGLKVVVTVGPDQARAGETPPAPARPAADTGFSGALAGARVLFVEDETVLALEIQAALIAAGATVVGPAASLSAALILASAEPIDLALLDVNVRGQSIRPVVEVLKARRVPYVLLTGYETPEIAGPVIRKPLDPRRL